MEDPTKHLDMHRFTATYCIFTTGSSVTHINYAEPPNVAAQNNNMNLTFDHLIILVHVCNASKNIFYLPLLVRITLYLRQRKVKPSSIFKVLVDQTVSVLLLLSSEELLEMQHAFFDCINTTCRNLRGCNNQLAK